MSGPQNPRFVLVGANHRSASADLRDRLFVDESDFGDMLSRLRGAGLDQALLLSTCDRVEVHTLHADPAVAERAIIETLAAHAGLAPDDIAGELYVLRDEAAARHLFAIAASLESLVIGEPFVLGQVKESHRAARAVDMVGAELERLLQATYAAAKRVRTETAIGERPVSIAATALAVARDVHGDLAGAVGLVIGVGEMAELVARQMREAGLGRLIVSHRSAARAASLARRLDANVQPIEALGDTLAAADIVICDVGLGGYVLTRDLMAEALARRRRRPVFIVDLAVPPDTDPAVVELDGAFVYDSADLERVAQAGLAGREAESAAAWQIVDAALADYLRARSMQAAVPAIVALRERFETAREGVLAETGGGDASAATRLLVQRLLHAPSEALREIAGEDGGGATHRRAERLLRRLFGLGADDTTTEEDQA